MRMTTIQRFSILKMQLQSSVHSLRHQRKLDFNFFRIDKAVSVFSGTTVHDLTEMLTKITKIVKTATKGDLSDGKVALF